MGHPKNQQQIPHTAEMRPVRNDNKRETGGASPYEKSDTRARRSLPLSLPVSGQAGKQDGPPEKPTGDSRDGGLGLRAAARSEF